MNTLNCTTCGTPMHTSREDVVYDAAGLSDVILRGVEVSRCPGCDEREVAIPRLPALHRALARIVVGKPGRLTGPEIRFLRKYLGFSGADFAEAMGSDPSTISRWENGKEPMNKHADRLLRLMVLIGKRVQKYHLANVARDDAGPSHYEATPEGDGWRAAIAA
jgi:putative zinc finger/helix-turn-helix YgiT family protein